MTILTSTKDHSPVLSFRSSAHIASLLDKLPLDVIQLVARVALAGVFIRSGMNKLSSWEFTVQLFRDEYRVPLLPAETAAYLATAVEICMPILLLLGLATRLATLPLLGMVLVIQVFVYPVSWPEHLTWAGLLLLLLSRGAGRVSVDHLVARSGLFRRRGE